MSTPRLLTKSEFIRGLNCIRRAWLDRHRPDLREPPSMATRDLMETGKRLGELARSRHADGVFVLRPGSEAQEAATDTQAALVAGHPCLFEATFIAEGRLARLDILHRDESGLWTVDEVKSSTLKEPKSIDEQKRLDLAFQFHTARAAGHPVSRARLVLVDSSFVWDGSPIDPHALFGVVDLTTECEEQGLRIIEHAALLADSLASDSEPEVELNTHCKDCDYFDHCHAVSPTHDLIFLPKISAKEVNALKAKGFCSIDDIPESEKLSGPRQRMRDVVVSGQPFISSGLRAALESVSFPAAFVDFESSNPAFPMFPGTRPYQQVCFQWSAHLLDHPDAAPAHREFLAADHNDPRPEFCRQLWESIRDCASIVHYSSFEKTQLKAMVQDGIPFAEDLLSAMGECAVDLETIIKDHVYFEGFKGRSSIKVVLPTLVPSLSYSNLAIGDGHAAAQSAFGFGPIRTGSTAGNAGSMATCLTSSPSATA